MKYCLPDNSILACHSTWTERQAGSDNSRETFWDSSDGKRYRHLEVVDSTLVPVSKDLVTEIRNVDKPADYADNGDDLCKEVGKLIEALL